MSQRQNCIGRKGKKEKSRQIKEVSVGESHFEAVLPGGNISPWPEGGRGEEEVLGRGGGVGGGGEGERTGEGGRGGRWGDAPAAALPSGHPQISM